MNRRTVLCLLLILPLGAPVFSGEVDVVKVAVKKNAKDTYDFSVTVLHQDTGWDHYANKWEVVDEKGTILGTRILHHPHVNEQPFTRSLSNVKIPDDISKVFIRAHDSVHGNEGKVASVKLP